MEQIKLAHGYLVAGLISNNKGLRIKSEQAAECLEQLIPLIYQVDKRCMECGGRNGFHIEHCSGGYIP